MKDIATHAGGVYVYAINVGWSRTKERATQHEDAMCMNSCFESLVNGLIKLTETALASLCNYIYERMYFTIETLINIITPIATGSVDLQLLVLGDRHAWKFKLIVLR